MFLDGTYFGVPLTRSVYHSTLQYLESCVTLIAKDDDAHIYCDLSDGFVKCAFIPGHSHRVVTAALTSDGFVPGMFTINVQ